MEDAKVAANDLIDTGAQELVVKAQVHAGGRGKGHFENGFKGGLWIFFCFDFDFFVLVLGGRGCFLILDFIYFFFFAQTIFLSLIFFIRCPCCEGC